MADKIRWQKLRPHGKQLPPMSAHTFESMNAQEVIRTRKERPSVYVKAEAIGQDGLEPQTKTYKIKSRNAKRK